MSSQQSLNKTKPALREARGPYLELSSFMPYRLNQLAHLVSRGIANIYEDRHGLTAAQWRVMAAVAETPGITAQKVVEMTPMDKVTVSRAVAALCEMELLQRTASKTDGRVALLSLTTDGINIYQQIRISLSLEC